jgi:hypothetical protein
MGMIGDFLLGAGVTIGVGLMILMALAGKWNP